jgi:DNA repair exonuclease SbcCD ATPase subunit
MKFAGIANSWAYLLPLLVVTSVAQVAPSPSVKSSAPVPYASISELNLMLSQLEQNSQEMQSDLARLRIEKWKTDSNTKRGTQSDVESIERNLQTALPEIMAQLKSSPESLPATFKLYRNLDALYDVFGSVTEMAGAFGSKDEYQSMQNDLNALERSRHTIADRMETLSTNKEGEITQLRLELQKAQAAAQPPEPPKKVVVDDTEPPKPPVKKKSKKSSSSSTAAQKPNPPATAQQPPSQ